ncbi:MAG TPA: energy transducer TonB [Candidatus Eisenbacteria bacterium]|jgi:protein TonB
MKSRAAISLLALPLLLSGGGHGFGAAHASDRLRLAGAAHTFTLSAGDATAPPASAPRGRRNPKVGVPKPRAVPAPAARPVPRPNPVGGHTTIAPFPVPGDTSRAAAERMKTLNVPKPGITTIAPLPAPTSPPMPTPVTPTPTPAPDQDPPRLGPDGKPLPAFGDYVYVEVLPEAIVRVPPTYPDDARRAGVDGVVMVQALVTRDGTVADVRVVKSIPMLDAAAAAAVRQWRFKPATSKGEPVAVWVGIPVKFTLH